VVGTNDYADTAGSRVAVITAGLARQPGMSRMDLLEKNAAIVGGVTEQIAAQSPEAIILVVSNPLDEMTYLAAVVSGFPKERVFGMAGVLDSSRLRYFIAEKLGIAPGAVEAITLGSHGDQMVALPAHATGAEIVGYLKKGSAYYAPSTSAAEMVRAILSDGGEVMPTCAWTTGQYGVSDVYLGVPARLGAGGVIEIVELELSDEESARLREAADAIRAKCEELDRARGTS
jgi:malate dehydrogenase